MGQLQPLTGQQEERLTTFWGKPLFILLGGAACVCGFFLDREKLTNFT